jgi:putative ABC transport system permease protein
VLSSYVDVTETLKQSGERTGLGPRTHRLRGLLVITEMALAVVLLAGAGLLTRSFLRLSEVQLGFDPHHLLLSDLYLPVKEVNQPQRQINFFHQTLERVRALPGVESAAATTHYPVSIFDELANGVLPYGATSSPLHRPSSLAYISSSYFRTLGVPLLKGRDFAEADAAGAQDVVILNESAARALFPQKDSVGNAISLDGPKGPWRQVVGVVGASRNYMLEREPWPEIFIPYRQPPSLNWSIFYMSFVIRTTGDPVGLVAAVRHAVASVDPAQPVAQTQTMADVVGKVLAPRRFKLLLLGSFALLALVLGAFGLYGVVSYAVTERTHEIGVRMALGAERNDVLRMVIGQALALTLVGAGIGITGALALTRYLTSLLYAIKADDPMTFVGASLLLVAIALLSSYIPARRATAVDPMIALRYE